MENTNTVNPSGENGVVAPNSGAVTPTANQGGETRERVFTQAELDNIVQQRLSKYADYAELKEYRESAEQAKLSEVEKLQKQISDLSPFKETAEKQQAILDGMLEDTLKTIPDNLKSLIPENFSPLDKLNYIQKNAEIFKSAPKPNMPKEEEPAKPNAGLYGGKYSTLLEFAQKDPNGYQEWRKKHHN